MAELQNDKQGRTDAVPKKEIQAIKQEVKQEVRHEVIHEVKAAQQLLIAKIEREMTVVSEYSGPLPHPSHLAEYEKIYPGAAKIIFDMAQAQAHHRQQLEDKVIPANITNERWGMGLTFILTAFIVFLGFLLIYSGKNIPAGVFTILAPVLALGANFFYAKRNERKKLEKIEKDTKLVPGEWLQPKAGNDTK